MSAESLEHLFPNLREGEYAITSPEDHCYNCAAWVAGDTRRRWWPAPDYYWPDWVLDDSVGGFVAFFQRRGYEPCEDRGSEPGYEKVAIYASAGLPSHIARQLPDGSWTSKLGHLEDVTHALEGLEGSDYGAVAAVLRRAAVEDDGATRG